MQLAYKKFKQPPEMQIISGEIILLIGLAFNEPTNDNNYTTSAHKYIKRKKVSKSKIPKISKY